MATVLVIFGFLSITIRESICLSESFPSETNNVFHGRFTRDVNGPELLVPRKVNKDGSFSTFSLPNFYDRVEVNERRKRSENLDVDKIHLVLPFNNADHHVELTPYHDFISPEMVIESRINGEINDLNERIRFKRVSDQQCHYRGFVRGHSKSKATMSLCDGVTGYVQTDQGRYFIEPMSESQPGTGGRHVHMIYQRQAPHENENDKPRCGTDDWESGWAEQLAQRERRLMENTDSTSLKRGNKPSSGTHSIHRFIEIGLVADKKFLDHYKGTDYEKYLLTIMNMVSDFYHDVSVGNQMDVVVVRIIYLENEKEEIDLSISPQAEDTLASFAAWAWKINPKEHTHPNHFDIAVLVTRHDICARDAGCTLMGLAYVATACDAEKAAAINEDSGLLLGIVIAHEVGHVMGCDHDQEDSSGCLPQFKDQSYSVMSPFVNIYTFQWSVCSRKFISDLLESGLGECLNDDPKSPSDKFKYPNMLPGAMYDADYQCNDYYPGSKFCDRGKGLNCEKLWCEKGTSCVSKNIPPAEGTKCGEKKWCIKKECVEMGSRPKAVHGGWGEWGEMSECSRTCGGGIRFSERECNKPSPANGGRYCMGERKKLSTCNTSPCDPNEPSFRALQCAEFNDKQVVSDGLHQWSPKLGPDLDPCELHCINEKKIFVKLAKAVKNATPCKGGTNYMCIFGTCRKVGCDWVIDGDAIEDKCGVCKGDGSHCMPVEGEFKKTSLSNYQNIAVIPKGARSIHIEEGKPSENTLAIKMEKGDKYCLNGNHMLFNYGDYECAGATLIYSSLEPEREEIDIKGPITENVQLQYCFYEPNENGGIKYKYFMPITTKSNYSPKYLWDFTEWTPCDAKCGGGTMVSEATCIEQQNGVVSSSFCQGITKPESKTRICNEKPCPAKWRVSQWSNCSACDKKKGTRHRKVQCVKRAARAGGEDVQADFKACKGKVPKQKEGCVGKRPCKKTCPKRSRHSESDKSLDQDKVDKFVDLGISRYLEDNDDEGASINNEVLENDLRSMLHELVSHDDDDEKAWSKDKIRSINKIGTVDKIRKYVTPKPGTMIVDRIPVNDIVLIEAPLKEDSLKSNLSDVDFHEIGDSAPVELDTSRQKIYKGEEAAKFLEEIGNPNINDTSEASNKESDGR